MDFFSRVRNAFVENLQGNLESLGLVIKRGGGANHLSCQCPFCDDKNGSASVEIHSGYLKCFQCSYGSPLFDWVARKEGLPGINEAVDLLGGRLQVVRPTRGAKSGKPPAALDLAELELSVDALWTHKDAGPFREELQRRGFSQSELMPFFLGFRYGHVAFPRIALDGSVHPHYHAWRGPWASGSRWIWAGAKNAGGSNYLWPAHIEPRPGRRLLLCEGEWDALVMRLKFDVDAYTWTGGANSPLVYSQLPSWASKRQWDICYDNDVWQGMDTPWAPDEKRMAELKERRRNLLERVARVLVVTCECEVDLLQVPFDPKEKWGGDLRDAWMAKKLTSIDSCTRTPYADATKPKAKTYAPIEIGSELPPERDVEVCGRAIAGLENQIWFPEHTFIQCPMGQQNYCSQCRLPTVFPSGTIAWSDDRELQAQIFSSRDIDKAINKHVIGKPTRCTLAVIKHSSEGRSMFQWDISHDEQDKMQTDVPVYSEVSPEMAAEMLVHGTTFLPKEGEAVVHVLADAARPHDRAPFQLQDSLSDLLKICPWESTDTAPLEGYLRARYFDLAANVTRIYGADVLHLAYDLVAHSCLWMDFDGGRIRAWADATIIGVTRCGKSQVVQRLGEHYGGLATTRSTQNNFSAAGLLAVQQKSARSGQWRSRPGLVPQSHGRMLVLDEFHLMIDGRTQCSPLEWLQECRDQGTLHVVKAQTVKYKAAVRLLTIANPIGATGFSSMGHPCEQLFELYGKPECISRLDFMLAITEQTAEEASGVGAPDVPPDPVFTPRICNALIRRAWEIKPEDIIFEPEAVQLAQDTVLAWGATYSLDLPLYTGLEKVRSILRLAISMANMVMSHVADKPMTCLVRKCHVKQVVEFLQLTFDLSGYGEYSLRSPDKAQLINSFEVEWFLLKNAMDAATASNLLRQLYGEFNQNELMAVMNMTMVQAGEWQSRMFRYGALARRRTSEGKFLLLRLTKPANKLARRLAQMADEEPDKYNERRHALSVWMDMKVGTPSREPNLVSLV